MNDEHDEKRTEIIIVSFKSAETNTYKYLRKSLAYFYWNRKWQTSQTNEQKRTGNHLRDQY